MTSKVDYRALLAQVHGTRYYFVPNVLRDGVAVSRLDAAQARWSAGSGLTEMVAEPGGPGPDPGGEPDVGITPLQTWDEDSQTANFVAHRSTPEQTTFVSSTAVISFRIQNTDTKAFSYAINIPAVALDSWSSEPAVTPSLSTPGVTMSGTLAPDDYVILAVPLSGTVVVDDEGDVNWASIWLSVVIPETYVMFNGYPWGDLEAEQFVLVQIIEG